MKFFRERLPEPTAEFLRSTDFLDWKTPAVQDFADKNTAGARTEVEKAVRLYYAVRDSIRYDPYRIELERRTFRASVLLKEGAGFCLPKANLLAASARAVGIHTAIGLSDVVNHLCTPRLRRLMGGKNLFLHHGYAVLYLEDRWCKAAPAFNIELCQRFNVLPTDFDGKSDALFQELDGQGRKHMEYVRDHGFWSDFPFERVVKDFRDYYPERLFSARSRGVTQRFEAERPLR